ncbi:gamma carbonic anhydrase family protein [Ammoniphilus sp. 3BR4]|uniref:gamma carbonic anhydrase family protein n=1 Tax=Ammoniphilus sp. 3BR4 TaxID=3158265 RepID=UPI0034666F52
MFYSYKNRFPQIDETAYIAPGSKIIGDVTIGKESSVWFNCVLRGDNDSIKIGNNVNIQDGSICHADKNFPLSVANDVSVGHNVILHGCTVGQGALIGMGSIILNNAEIGEYALVGAGSLIPEGKKIPPRTLVMGSPAKVVRELTDRDLENLNMTTQGYLNHCQQYKEEMVKDKKEISPAL